MEHLIYPAVQANCIYEVQRLACSDVPADGCSQGVYLLGTSLARPVIARGMMDIVKSEDCQCVGAAASPDQARADHRSLSDSSRTVAPERETTRSDSSSPSTPLAPR